MNFFKKTAMMLMVFILFYINGLSCMKKVEEEKSPLLKSTKNTQDMFFEYLNDNNIDELTNLLNKHSTEINLNLKNINGDTPLIVASQKDNKKIVRLFLDHGAEIEVEDKNERTPLFMAVEQGNKAIVELLLRRNARTEARDMQWNTPLMIAIQKGYVEIVKMLLNRGANVDVENRQKVTVYDFVSQSNNDEIKNLFEEYKDHYPISLINEALEKDFKRGLLNKKIPFNNAFVRSRFNINDIDVLKNNFDDNQLQILMKQAYKLNFSSIDRKEFLSDQAYKAYSSNFEKIQNKMCKLNVIPVELLSETLKLMWPSGVKNDPEKMTIIFRSQDKDDVVSARCHKSILMIRSGLFENFKSSNDIPNEYECGSHLQNPMTDIYYYRYLNYSSIKMFASLTFINFLYTENLLSTARLYEGDWRPGIKDQIELLYGLGEHLRLHHNTTFWGQLKKYGKGVSVSDDFRRSIVDECEKQIADNNINRVSELIDRYSIGRSALLFFAALKGKEDIVKLLIKNGADVNYIGDNGRGQTPLYLAIENGSYDITKLLIENRANVNLRGDNGRGKTPLYLAIEKGNSDIAKLLMDNKADINSDYYGETPLLKAIEILNIDIVKLLIEYGADINVKRYINVGSFFTDVTPLSLAVNYGSSLKNNSIIELLINNGATISEEVKRDSELIANAINSGRMEKDFIRAYQKELGFDTEINGVKFNKTIILARLDVKKQDPNVLLNKLQNIDAELLKTLIHQAYAPRFFYVDPKNFDNNDEYIEYKKNMVELKSKMDELGIKPVGLLSRAVQTLNLNRSTKTDSEKTDSEYFKINYNPNNKKTGNYLICHKFILMIRSKLFENMFQDCVDTSNEVSYTGDVSYDALKFFINFLYTEYIYIQKDLLKNYQDLSKLVGELSDLGEFYQLHKNTTFFSQLNKLATKHKIKYFVPKYYRTREIDEEYISIERNYILDAISSLNGLKGLEAFKGYAKIPKALDTQGRWIYRYTDRRAKFICDSKVFSGNYLIGNDDLLDFSGATINSTINFIVDDADLADMLRLDGISLTTNMNFKGKYNTISLKNAKFSKGTLLNKKIVFENVTILDVIDLSGLNIGKGVTVKFKDCNILQLNIDRLRLARGVKISFENVNITKIYGDEGLLANDVTFKNKVVYHDMDSLKKLTRALRRED